MHPAAIAEGLVVGFAVVVVFAKYVISEAASIKQHVTDEVAELRADVNRLVKVSTKP